MLFLQFLTILLCNDHCFLHIKLLIVAIGLNNGLLQFHMLTHRLQISQYLAIVSNCNAIFACYNEGKSECICVTNTIFSRENTLPKTKSIEQLKFLTKQKSDPTKTIVEWVDPQHFQSIPSRRLYYLYQRQKYQQHCSDVTHAFMNSILFFCKITHVQLKNVRHEGIKHIETSSFLYSSTIMIYYIKNWSKDLIHSLHILHLRVQSCEDEEDTRHIIVAVSSAKLLRRKRSAWVAFSTDQFMLFAAGASIKGNRKRLSKP